MTPTAKEFIKIYLKNNPEGTYDLCMIEFAKLHVEEALKEASKKSLAQSTNSNMSSKDDRLTCIHLGKVYVNKDSILNAYPSTNIK